jgi:hypothetical protein
VTVVRESPKALLCEFCGGVLDRLPFSQMDQSRTQVHKGGDCGELWVTDWWAGISGNVHYAGEVGKNVLRRAKAIAART